MATISGIYKIVNNINGKVYKSIKDASIDTKAQPANILKVCRGHRKTSAGLVFRKEQFNEGIHGNSIY